jgi:hypothetical protein
MMVRNPAAPLGSMRMIARNSGSTALLISFLVLSIAPHLSAQKRSPMKMPQHESGMHPGPTAMHHAFSPAAKLAVSQDASANLLKVRVGPVKLAAHADHMAVAQPRDSYLTIPFDGWLVAYHPRVVDASGTAVSAKVLHHVAFWNTGRSDFLCPNKEEHIFGAGGEMNDWPAIPGVGYRVRNGDRVRISTMFANPGDTAFPELYLDVQVEYRAASTEAAPLKSVYPTWFDVEECRESGYDLEPGKSFTAARFTMKFQGALLGVGGHLHDYGRGLVLDDVTHKSAIANLKPQTDPSGRLLSIPVISFADSGGYRLEPGQVLRVTATYDNPTGRYLLEGAMGIVVGYFLPDQDSALVAFERRRAK